MDYQQLQGAASGSGRPHNLPSRVIEQIGVLIVENSDSAVAEGGSLDSSREVQDKLERRRKQKRDSARRVRGNQKQDFLRLQRTYNKNLGRKEKLEGEISRLKANAQYFESMMRTLRQMQMIPESPRPSPPPNLPVVAGAETSGHPRPSPPPTLPGVAGDEASSPVTPPVTGIPLQTLEQSTLTSASAAGSQFLLDSVLSAGGDAAGNGVIIPVRAQVWNQNPADHSLPGPGPEKLLPRKPSGDHSSNIHSPGVSTPAGSSFDLPDLTFDQGPPEPLSLVTMATASDVRTPSPLPSAPGGFDPMPALSSEDVDLLQFLADFLAPAGKGEAKNSYSYGGNPRDLLMNDTELRAPIPIADTVSESAALDKPNS